MTNPGENINRDYGLVFTWQMVTKTKYGKGVLTSTFISLFFNYFDLP